MRWLPALLFAAAAWGQSPPFTIEQVLAAAFPTELTAAPAGGKVAWVSNARGVRNIMVAEPPGYAARGVTNYAADDGQEIQDLRWTPGASAILYLRGGSANPGDNPSGVSQDLWIVRPDGSAPRKIGPASSPAVSPRGDQVAFVRSGQIWWQALAGEAPQTSVIRGSCDGPRWSPDGAHIAFTTVRADHSLIGVIDVATRAFRYLDPSTNFDNQPVWAPDSRSIAFIRQPSSGIRPVRAALRSGEPWSIRIATLETGAGRELWRAREGAGSVFREISARNQLIWTDSGRVVFPWEGDAWTHLYSIPAQGGSPLLLTPGAFEVEDAAPASADRIFYSSNENDADRRHIWVVPASGGERQRITPGEGIECSPAPLNDANAAYPSLAFFGSDAQHPLHPVLDLPTGARDLDPRSIPADFPLAHMVTPKPVIFPAADGLQIHGQLFLPPHPSSAASPAVVFFHGGPRRQMLLGWHYMDYYSNAYAMNQYLANAGFLVLSVNFRSGIGYGLDFREAPGYGPSGASEYNDVLGAAAYLASRADVDRARIAAWGGSYGGFLTALALARDSAAYRAGVDFHGVHNWAKELQIPPTEPDYKAAFDSSPMAFLDGWRSPALFIAGDDDPDVQFNQTVMLADALRRRNVDIETLIFPDEVHGFLLHKTWVTAYQAAAEFLIRRLK